MIGFGRVRRFWLPGLAVATFGLVFAWLVLSGVAANAQYSRAGSSGAPVPRALASQVYVSSPYELSNDGASFLAWNELRGGFESLKDKKSADGKPALRTVVVRGAKVREAFPYNDSKGYCTMGFGHLLTPKHRCTLADIKKYGGWTLDQALGHEKTDVQWATNLVNKYVDRSQCDPLTQTQVDALIDFTFNAGPGAYHNYVYKKGKKGKLVRGKNGKPIVLYDKGANGLHFILALVNSGQDDKVPAKIEQYISSGERKHSPGLITRRRIEALMYGGLTFPQALAEVQAKTVRGPRDASAGAPPCHQVKPTPTPTTTTITTPTTTPTTPTVTVVPVDCSQDDLDSPPPVGCYRVTVQIVTAPLPSDPMNSYDLGYGVGSATIEPGGQTYSCVNPSDSCVFSADVPVDTVVTVTEQPGSLEGDPASPPDSEFWKFGGACSGASGCTFTPTSNSTVEVYFIPATATLTFQAVGDDQANMAALGDGEGLPVDGSDPVNGVYCGEPRYETPLPCSIILRVDEDGAVYADSYTPEAPYQPYDGSGFSDNCTWFDGLATNECVVAMTSDQTVTATFSDEAPG